MDYCGIYGEKSFICNIHNKKIEFIYLKDDSQSKLACSKCCLQNKLDPDYILEIGSLLDQKNESIIRNLPLGLSTELYEQLISNNILSSKKDQLIEEVSNEFNRFSDIIISAINNHKKQLINHINLIEEKRMIVINNYNIIASKNHIRQKIIELSHNPSQLDEYLRNLIQTKKTCLQSEENKVQDSINNHQNELLKINIDNIHNTLLILLETVRSTSFLYSKNIINNKNNNDGIIHNPSSPQSQSSSLLPIQQLEQNQSILISEEIKINSIEQLLSTTNISQYENIYINFNCKDIGDKGIKQMSKCLYDCKWVKQLNLDLRCISRKLSSILDLCQSLKQMKLMNKLSLDLGRNDYIASDLIQKLTQTLSLSNINYLSLSLSENEDVTDEETLDSIAPFLSSLTKLEYLELRLNDTSITGKAVKYIANSLNKYSKIKILRLVLRENMKHGYNFQVIDSDSYSDSDDDDDDDNDGIRSLSKSIQSLKSSLIQLFICFENNQIGQYTALNFFNSITSCTNLEKLEINLSDNKLRQPCKNQIRQIIESFKSKYSQQLKHVKIDL